jgi:hypothetical protein
MTAVAIENERETIDPGAAPSERNGAAPTREVRHEYTHSLPPVLSQLGISLLVSTYQAGKVVAVGVADGELALELTFTVPAAVPSLFHNSWPLVPSSAVAPTATICDGFEEAAPGAMRCRILPRSRSA